MNRGSVYFWIQIQEAKMLRIQWIHILGTYKSMLDSMINVTPAQNMTKTWYGKRIKVIRRQAPGGRDLAVNNPF